MSARMRSQLRTLFPVLMGLYIPMLIVVLIAVLVSFQLSIPIASLTRDPSATTGESPFLGALSNIGILFWCASTAICFFTFAVLHKKALRGNFQAFFLFSGLISLILLLDDLFLLHEMVFPIYLKIPEKLIFLSYGLMILIYLVKFTKTIIKTNFIFFNICILFLWLINNYRPFGFWNINSA